MEYHCTLLVDFFDKTTRILPFLLEFLTSPKGNYVAGEQAPL
jgi:hypothetical protein